MRPKNAPSNPDNRFVMPSPKLADVSSQYEQLFQTCVITNAGEVQQVVTPILRNRQRYEDVSEKSGVPWYVIAVIHNMECSLNFRQHLHNGDPLSRPTVNVPAGRPPGWTGTGTWEESALDALAFDKMSSWTDWSIAGIMFKLEGYNGWGYRSHGINTPYLWSFTNHYTKGKYVSDGTWSDSAVSQQCGCAAVLRRLAEMGEIVFSAQPVPKAVAVTPGPNAETPVPTAATSPIIRFSNTKPTDPAQLAAAEDFQRWLNTFSGVSLTVDGATGKNTSDAFKLVTGHYLMGDPRA
jgi:lysozyme family protein